MEAIGADRDPLEVLAEEFVRRHRRGERPSIDEYAAGHPQLADGIRRTFPAALMLERLRPTRTEVSSGSGAALLAALDLERLGDYRILREVGRGGMGVVYEAEQVSLGRRVALKVLPGLATGLNQSLLRRFDLEARAAARLHHTNIVPVFGVGEDRGFHYYVMQFIQGQGMDAVLAQLRESADADAAPGADGGGQSYWASVASIGLQVADALQYAHDSGILHRDIKPSNLMLDVNGRVWVTDFGLAKLDGHDDLTADSDILGTLRYLAPERLKGQCDARGDIYSLGLVLYEQLCLRPAFDAAHRPELLEQISRHAPIPPRQINPHIPRDLETIVMKAISRQSSDRYATAAELAQDLRRFLEDKPIHARPVSAVEHLARWCRRNPVPAALSTCLFLLLLAIAVGSVIAAGRFSRLAKDHAQARLDAEASLADLYASNGLTAAGRHDDAEAALWFAGASELAIPGSEMNRQNGERALLWTANLPKPIAAFRSGTSPVVDISFDATGGYLACQGTGGAGHPLTIWDLARQQSLDLPAVLNSATCVAWSQDGRRLAVGAADGSVSLLSFPDFKQLGTTKLGLPPQRLAFGCSNRLIVCTPGQVRLLAVSDAAPDLLIPPIACNEGVGAAVTDEGRVLITAEGSSLVWRRTETGQLLGATPLEAKVLWLTGAGGVPRIAAGTSSKVLVFDAGKQQPIASANWNRAAPSSAALSPDGMTLIVCSGGVMSEWSVTDGLQPRSEFTAAAGATHATFSSDARLIATCGDGLVRVWARSPGPLQSFRIPVAGRHATASFDRSGRHVLVSGPCTNLGVVRSTQVYDVRTGRPAGPVIHVRGGLRAAALSPDGSHLAAASSAGTLQMFDSKTGRALSPLTQLPSEPMGLAYDAAGRRLAVRCRGGALLVLDAASGRVIRQWAVAPLGEMEQWLVIGGGVCWGPGATTVITWGTDIVEVWETESGTRKYPPLKHNAVCGSVCVSASGQYLATTSWDGAARVWRLSSGELAATLAHGSVVYSAWFTAGDHLLLTHGDGATLRAWDWRTGQRAQGDHLSHPHGADVSPDGRWVVGGAGPRSASVAIAATGAIAAPSIPVTGEPAVIRIAPDGMSAAASGRAEWVDLIRLDALQATGAPTPQWSRTWSELVAGRRIHHGSLVGLTTSEWMNRWEAVAAARPTMPPVPSEAARWHVLRASDAAGARDPMAEAFHLRRLIASSAADWAVHARAAELSTAQCEWAQAAALLEAAARLNPEDEDLLIRRADVLLGLGDEAAAAEAFARVLRLNGRHWVRGGWWTAGPYAGGLSQEPPAEARPEVSAPIAVPTGGQGTRWALHHHTAPSLELHPLFGNAQHVFGYAQTFVYSPDEREVSLGIGADDGVQVWLNGQKVFEHASFLDAGSRTVTVRLKPGINRLLAKVANDRLHHRLYLDLSDGP